MKNLIIFFMLLMANIICICQNKTPDFTKKKIISKIDELVCKDSFSLNGFNRECSVPQQLDIYTYDDSKITFVALKVKALVFEEGNKVLGVKQGYWNRYIFIEDKKININKLNYKNGKLNGECLTYSIEEKLVRKDSFIDGLFSGLCLDYGIDGRVLAEVQMRDNKRNGITRIYDLKSTRFFQREMLYTDDSLKRKISYYPNGLLQEDASWENGKLNGSYLFYYDNGQIWTERNYNNGILIDVKSNYSKDGKPREIGTFKNGNGLVYSYDEKGNIIEKVEYVNGIEKM